MRICAILMGMNMAFVMAGLSDDGQGSKTNKGNLAEHFERLRLLVIDLVVCIGIVGLEL